MTEEEGDNPEREVLERFLKETYEETDPDKARLEVLQKVVNRWDSGV